jgi:NodT family efflux transporter outer membrane factor (OMF) lipoprotein
VPDVSAKRSLLRASLAALAPLALCACMVGPDFTRPAVPWFENWSTDALHRAEQEALTQRTVQVDQWWREFGDVVLEQLVEEAQRLNPGVRTAGLRILEARAQLGIAGSNLYPQLQQLGGDALWVGTQQSDGPDQDFWTSSTGLDVVWELDFWGKFRRGIEAADAEYLASIVNYDDLQVLVAAQAASFYASFRTFEQRLRIAHENAALQKRSLEITERLFRSGNESELDVQQALTLYLSTLATIPEIEGSLRQAQNALAILLARPPDRCRSGRGRERIRATSESSRDAADLLRRRPDVRTAELQLAAQSARIGVSKSELYPAIALGGSFVVSASSLMRSAYGLDWGVGPALVWNFDYNRLTNQVRVQDARFQQLFEQYRDTVLRAARELEDAAIGFAQRRAQVAILEDSVQAARRSLDIADVQYREGLVDFQRVLDSQRALFGQQERLVTTRGAVAQSLIALYKALGGGWQPARSMPILDDETRAEMAERSNWRRLLDAPLPPASEDSQSPP